MYLSKCTTRAYPSAISKTIQCNRYGCNKIWDDFKTFLGRHYLNTLKSTMDGWIAGAVWPDLVKFHHFGKKLKVFGNFLLVYLEFGIIFSILWQFCNGIEDIFIAVFG